MTTAEIILSIGLAVVSLVLIPCVRGLVSIGVHRVPRAEESIDYLKSEQKELDRKLIEGMDSLREEVAKVGEKVEEKFEMLAKSMGEVPVALTMIADQRRDIEEVKKDIAEFRHWRHTELYPWQRQTGEQLATLKAKGNAA